MEYCFKVYPINTLYVCDAVMSRQYGRRLHIGYILVATRCKGIFQHRSPKILPYAHQSIAALYELRTLGLHSFFQITIFAGVISQLQV